MKELSIEEKVKAYDGNYKVYTELINRLEDVKEAIKKQNYGIVMDILCKPYPEYQITASPELKESEDEKIRKCLLGHFSRYQAEEVFLNNIKMGGIVSWLEKQGEKDEEILILKDQIESLHTAIKAVKETNKIELERQGKQKPVEWSEEDSNMLQSILDEYKSMAIEKRNWLKSLKDRVVSQSPWKPTEEQIMALRNVSMKSASDISRQTQVLGELYEQLKVL